MRSFFALSDFYFLFSFFYIIFGNSLIRMGHVLRKQIDKLENENEMNPMHWNIWLQVAENENK